MTSLLTNHLSQIALCATSIAALPFPNPQIFTNALLSPTHDITSLIRDTEQHERALFHLAPPPLPPKAAGRAAIGGEANARRATQYAPRQPKNKAVAAVLGGDLYQWTRRTEDSHAGRQQQQQQQQKGEIDVEVLLHGAEKLAAVYPIPNAADKITALRRRHQQLEANIAHYEARVAEQTRELQAMSSRPRNRGDDDEQEKEKEKDIPLTKEDLEKEEDEVRELERKKKGLEERVEGMERDLGGLMR